MWSTIHLGILTLHGILFTVRTDLFPKKDTCSAGGEGGSLWCRASNFIFWNMHPFSNTIFRVERAHTCLINGIWYITTGLTRGPQKTKQWSENNVRLEFAVERRVIICPDSWPRAREDERHSFMWFLAREKNLAIYFFAFSFVFLGYCAFYPTSHKSTWTEIWSSIFTQHDISSLERCDSQNHERVPPKKRRKATSIKSEAILLPSLHPLSQSDAYKNPLKFQILDVDIDNVRQDGRYGRNAENSVFFILHFPLPLSGLRDESITPHSLYGYRIRTCHHQSHWRLTSNVAFFSWKKKVESMKETSKNVQRTPTHVCRDPASPQPRT